MQLTIEKLVYGGDGLARIDSADGRKKSVFVPLVLPGEKVEATLVEQRAGFARARVEKVLEPSLFRTAPPCPYFGRCGGCHLQHTTYENQLQLKKEIVRETVARIAKLELPEIETHASRSLLYRNRTRMKLTAGGSGKFEIGYYRLGSHELLPVRQCPISSPLINRALQALWSLAMTMVLPNGLAEIEFFADAEDARLEIELLVERDSGELKSFAEALKAALPEIAGIVAIPRARQGDEVVAAPELSQASQSAGRLLVGEPSLTYRVDEFAYHVSAGAFFQTNRFLTPKLIDIAVGDASGYSALDLYAGVGLFTLPLATRFEQVTAVEASPVSFGDLKRNTPSNVKTIKSRTEAFLARPRGNKPEFAIVDPPRAGLGKRVVAGLVKLRPDRLSYVSCDPSTLARDLPELLSARYRIRQAHMVDLFPQTFHIETVLKMER